MTPLHMIISKVLSEKFTKCAGYRLPKECIAVINELARVGKDIDAQGHLGLSYLHVLCTLEDSSRLERHLNNIGDIGYVINATSSIRPGFIALHFAALCNINSVKIFVSKGADITIEDADGKTPLDVCIARYSIEDIHDILARSAFKDVALTNGKTKLTDLIYSMRSLGDFKTLLRELGDANACIPVDSILWPGHTPLHLAIVFRDRVNVNQREMFVQMTEECLENGIDVHAKGVLEETPMQFAFRRGSALAVDLMLKHHRGKWNPVDENDLSDLHVACAIRKVSLVEALLRDGANVHCKLGSTVKWYDEFERPNYSSTPDVFLREGSTPLHVAVTIGHLELARLLLNRGADPQAQDADGMSVIHRLLLFRSKGSWELLNELLSLSELRECVVESCGLSHLHVACYRGHTTAVKKLLLEPEPAVNRAISCNKYGLSAFEHETPLRMVMHRDRDQKRIEVVKLLLQHGADILFDSGKRGPSTGYRVMTRSGYSREDCYWDLFVAAIRSNEDLRRRIDERIPGLTDLHLACYIEQDLAWIAELLAKGADVNARIRGDSTIWRGCTPLHVLMRKTSKSGEPDVVLQLLLDNGADVTVPESCHSDAPLHLAETWSSRIVDCDRGTSAETEDCRKLHRVEKSTWPDVPCDRASLMIRGIKDFTSNPTNISGVSHFHMACWCLDVDAVDGFLRHGVDVNAKMDYHFNCMGGYTPLHVTLTREVSSPRKIKIVELLLKYGADVRAESYSGNTPLHYAAMYCKNDGLPIFAMILEYAIIGSFKNKRVVELFDTILCKRYEHELGELKCLVKLQYRYYLA